MRKFGYARIVIYIATIIILLLMSNGTICFPCYWKENYGISCPTCGVTRATKSIFQLQFADAIKYHAMYTLVLVPFIFLIVINDIFIILKRSISNKKEISYVEILLGYAKK